MDLCGPLRLQSINGKKYILVIVDDYSRFTWVKFLRSKDETPAFIINLLKQLQVGLNKIVRYVRTDNGTEFVNKDLTDYYESVGITHEKTILRTPQQNGVVERQNRTLVEAARTMLIFSKAPKMAPVQLSSGLAPTFLMPGQISSGLVPNLIPAAPYVPPTNKDLEILFQLIFHEEDRLRTPQTGMALLNKGIEFVELLGHMLIFSRLPSKADIGFFVGYAPNRKGYRIYNKRTRQIMETIHVTFDELTEQTAPVHSSSGPNPNLLTPGPISSGLVPNSAPAIPYVPPTNRDLELLFQPMFDEYFETPTGDHQMTHVPAVPPPVIPTGPSVSISFDHDAPSGSHSPSSSAHQSSSGTSGVATTDSEASSSGEMSRFIYPTNLLNTIESSSQYGTDSHPIDNIIGNPSRPVSTRKQLATDALWCFYNSVLSKVEPKNFKSAVTEDCWFQAMQDEIYEFDRLDVWELVPPPDCAMIISFKSSTSCLPSEESSLRVKAGTPGVGTSRASGLSPVPLPPPPPSTSQSDQPKSTDAPSSSKTAASAQYTAWTTTDSGHKPSVTSIPEDLHMDDNTAPDEQPLTEDKPTTLKPSWSIPSSDLPVPENNWASALASTYAPPLESSLLAYNGDMEIFMDWFCKKQRINELKQQDLEGLAYEIVKVFHPNIIHLQFQMEECHKLLTDQKDLEYLRYGRKIGRPALPISKMKAAYYPDVGLEQMVPDQMWIEEECKYDIAAIAVRTHMRILSVVQIEVFSLYVYDYMKTIVLRRADLKEHIIAERDFKYLYPSDFEDLDKYGVQKIMRFNKIHKFSDDTLQQINEALDYRVKEFKVNRMNPGLNTRFWTRKDVDRSKEFMFAIQKWIKTRRIYRNLESFFGGRIRDGDYRLLQRTK
ncbi:putative ribonuclease H-like domain-containing protein [Tanacetum coccineum]